MKMYEVYVGSTSARSEWPFKFYFKNKPTKKDILRELKKYVHSKDLVKSIEEDSKEVIIDIRPLKVIE